MGSANLDIKFGTPATFFDNMFLLFLGLKLANIIDWAWIWVFAPIWGTLIVEIILLFIVKWRNKK